MPGAGTFLAIAVDGVAWMLKKGIADPAAPSEREFNPEQSAVRKVIDAWVNDQRMKQWACPAPAPLQVAPVVPVVARLPPVAIVARTPTASPPVTIPVSSSEGVMPAAAATSGTQIVRTATMPMPGCTSADETGIVIYHLERLATGQYRGWPVLATDMERLERAAIGAERMG